MEPSDELKKILLRMYDALSASDADGFCNRFSSRMQAIGTDPNEWWTDLVEWRQIVRTQTEEVGGWRWIADDPQAWTEGTVGWVTDRPTLEVSGKSIALRLTMVL